MENTGADGTESRTPQDPTAWTGELRGGSAGPGGLPGGGEARAEPRRIWEAEAGRGQQEWFWEAGMYEGRTVAWL